MIVASDLTTKHQSNALDKFADDTYLIIPASCVHSTEDELTNIENWAKENNLKLNRNKSKEMLFAPPKSKAQTFPPAIEGIERVSQLKCLGVTFTPDFSFATHISNTISSCSSNLFALYCLRSKGLSDDLLHLIFQAATLSKLFYASSFW